MIMKLKTLDQIKEEYKKYCCYHNKLNIIYFKDNMVCITHHMFHMFGKKHKVKISERNDNIYIIHDIKNDIHWDFHKDWFLPVDFIKDGEMIL